MKLIIATKNKGKIKEIRESLNGLDVENTNLNDFPEIKNIPETGSTFEENAWLKAKAVYEHFKILTLADDSGLEVDYLSGMPGVHSARYARLRNPEKSGQAGQAGDNAADSENRAKLLHELKGIAGNNRSARFVCVMILYDGVSNNIFKGVCEGKITESERGANGFGYDSLFVPDGYDKTFGELGMETKNKISHRGKALTELREYLQHFL